MTSPWLLAAILLFSGWLIQLMLQELSELSPWLAEQMISWAVRSMVPEEYREPLEDQLIAQVEGRPGKLLKLMTAIGIVLWMPSISRAVQQLPPLHIAIQRRVTYTTGSLLATAPEYLIHQATQLLPRAYRQRYHQEWLAELDLVPGRAAKLRMAMLVTLFIPRMAWTLVRLG